MFDVTLQFASAHPAQALSMAASMNNIDVQETPRIYQLIELIKADDMQQGDMADLKDELDKVNALTPTKLRVLNVSCVQARGDDPAWRSVV